MHRHHLCMYENFDIAKQLKIGLEAFRIVKLIFYQWMNDFVHNLFVWCLFLNFKRANCKKAFIVWCYNSSEKCSIVFWMDGSAKPTLFPPLNLNEIQLHSIIHLDFYTFSLMHAFHPIKRLYIKWTLEIQLKSWTNKWLRSHFCLAKTTCEMRLLFNK